MCRAGEQREKPVDAKREGEREEGRWLRRALPMVDRAGEAEAEARGGG